MCFYVFSSVLLDLYDTTSLLLLMYSILLNKLNQLKKHCLKIIINLAENTNYFQLRPLCRMALGH